MEQLTTIQQINRAIMIDLDLTNEQLDSIIDAVKWRRASLVRYNANTLRVGSEVKFVSSRNRMTYTGKVESIKIKNAIVATPQGRFKVPMNMLTAA